MMMFEHASYARLSSLFFNISKPLRSSGNFPVENVQPGVMT
jgi:hypothetical protein